VYARQCLPILERVRPPGLSLYDLAFVTYYVRQGGMRMPDIGGGPAINAIADQLPERTPALARRVAAGLTPDRLAGLAVRAADRHSAVALMEAAEGVAALTREGLQQIAERHAPEPPNPDHAVSPDEVRTWTRLIASGAALANLAADDVSAIFGPMEQRAAAVVAATPNGLSCRLEQAPDGLVVSARLLAVSLPDAPADRSEPPGPYGDPDSPNARAVALCRQLLDSCPEADIAEVLSVDASGQEIPIDRHKRIPRSSLPRPTVTRISVGWDAAVARLTMAPSWSTRLREQAQLSAALVQLLRQLPARLRSNDNAGRRRRWRRQVEQHHAQAAALPRPPKPADDEATAGDLAAQDEATRRRDPPRAALQRLTQALKQLSDGLDADDASRNRPGIATQLREATKQLEEARAAGAPYFAGIGDTLPTDLADLAALAADLLLALEEDPLRERELKTGDEAVSSAQRLIETVMTAQQAKEKAALDSRLREAGVDPEVRYIPDPDPSLLRVGRQQCVVLVPVGQWEQAWQALTEWPAKEQEDLRSNITMVVVDEEGALPIGARHFHAYDHTSTIPITVDDLRPLVSKAGLPLLDGPLLEAATSLLNDIVRWSAIKARAHLRDGRWWQPQAQSESEAQLRGRARMISQTELIAPETRRMLNDAFEQVLGLVAAEPNGGRPLAAEVAGLPDLDGPPSPKLAAFSNAVLLAMEAQAQAMASDSAR
jgi:hypothetical protein